MWKVANRAGLLTGLLAATLPAQGVEWIAYAGDLVALIKRKTA